MLNHAEAKITEQILDNKWDEGCDIIHGLGYAYDTHALKIAFLDPRADIVREAILSYVIQYGPAVDSLVVDFKNLKAVITNLETQKTLRHGREKWREVE